MKQYFLSVQGVRKTFQGISLCCARDCSLHPVVYFLSVSLLWFIWLSVLQRDHNSAEKSWAKEPGENSRLVSHCWWQLTELFSSRTLCRVKSMKTLQQNPAFVGDDGQSTASTLPMSVSSPPRGPERTMRAKYQWRPQLIGIYCTYPVAARTTNGVGWRPRGGQVPAASWTRWTRHLGQRPGVPHVLHSHVCGSGQCVAFPIHSTG